MSPIDAHLAAPPRAGDMPVDADTKSAKSGSVDTLTQSKIVVLGVLFLVTGALGLPLLWVNRRFSAVERWFWSAAVLAYTAALIGVTVAIVSWAYSRLFP